jgi:myo-inositol-hexaphosphate 3-phosphohydrolase
VVTGKRRFIFWKGKKIHFGRENNMIAVNSEEAMKKRRRDYKDDGSGEFVYLSSFMENYPQCYLVEQLPNDVVRAHFHTVNQFQLIVDGDGKFGKDLIRPLSIHYDEKYKPYGPIVAGEKGISYFTIRTVNDIGANWMPEFRNKREKGARESFYKLNMDEKNIEQLKQLTEPEFETLFSSSSSGAAAYRLAIGPDQQKECPSPQGNGGQYVSVVNGTCIINDEPYPRWSCIFLEPDEPPLNLQAGPEGIEVLVLQFPKNN